MSEQKRFLSNGEVVIRSEEGVYFLAPHEDAIPLLIDKEEGESLFSKAIG